jgi:hypothetical protein
MAILAVHSDPDGGGYVCLVRQHKQCPLRMRDDVNEWPFAILTVLVYCLVAIVLSQCGVGI